MESLNFDYMRIANLLLSNFYQSIQEEWDFCWNYALEKGFPGRHDNGEGQVGVKPEIIFLDLSYSLSIQTQ